MMPFHRKTVATLLAGLTTLGARAQAPDTVPLPTEMEESIEVRLVTIDVVALDAADRTVADLGKDDFELSVDGKPVGIDTLDVFCTGGPEADPKSLRVGGWSTPQDLEQGKRRIVLAFDYLHLPTTPCPDGGPCLYHTRSLENFQDVIASKSDIRDEQIMVVSLTGGLRVEQPFTTDREAVVDSLHRMEHDVSLWNGTFSHLTEEPLFRSLNALVNVLRTYPGPKAVVFISAGPGPGNRYDLDYESLAAAASDAQVSFYTVDCAGMDMPVRFT